MTLRNALIQIIIGSAIIYFCFGLFLFVNQKSMLYYPDGQEFSQCEGFSEYAALESNGTRFYFLNGTSQVIVYYHGNAGSACDRSRISPLFEKSNASLIFVEYAGYSNDTIRPSRDLILRDVINIHDYVRDKGYQRVIVYGQSLGSGAASYHAYLGGVDDLILVSPFSTMDSLAKSKYVVYPASILLREKYDNSRWLQHYNGSLLIVHGDRDMVIPARFSQELFERVHTKNKEYVMVEGRGHNDLWSSTQFQEAIQDHIER